MAPAGRMAWACLRTLYGVEPILIRTPGGSVPISPFVETLGIPAASVPTVNIDNNQHRPKDQSSDVGPTKTISMVRSSERLIRASSNDGADKPSLGLLEKP